MQYDNSKKDLRFRMYVWAFILIASIGIWAGIISLISSLV